MVFIFFFYLDRVARVAVAQVGEGLGGGPASVVCVLRGQVGVAVLDKVEAGPVGAVNVVDEEVDGPLLGNEDVGGGRDLGLPLGDPVGGRDILGGALVRALRQGVASDRFGGAPHVVLRHQLVRVGEVVGGIRVLVLRWV